MEESDIKQNQKKSRKIFRLIVTIIIFFVVALTSVMIRYIRSYNNEQSKYGFIVLDEVK